jgi:hypothetical protein
MHRPPAIHPAVGFLRLRGKSPRQRQAGGGATRGARRPAVVSCTDTMDRSPLFFALVPRDKAPVSWLFAPPETQSHGAALAPAHVTASATDARFALGLRAPHMRRIAVPCVRTTGIPEAGDAAATNPAAAQRAHTTAQFDPVP